MKRNRIVPLAVFLLVFQLGLARIACSQGAGAANTAQPQTQPETDYARLAVSLEQSGLNYLKVQPNLWKITLKDKDKEKSRDFFIVTNKDVVSFVVVVGPKLEKVTQGSLGVLATLNARYYFVKFTNDDTNMLLKVDMLLRSLDGVVLRDVISRLNATFENETMALGALVEQKEMPKEKPKGK